MSETANTAKMSDILSDEIFSVFGWTRVGPTNHPWECVELEKHHKKTVKVHPSDVVYKYRDPYRGLDIYINADLKSYAATTIQTTDLGSALRSLAMAAECANKSPGWQSAYLRDSANHEVVALLFIFNHDGEFDKNFGTLLSAVTVGQVKVEQLRKVFVMGPERIAYLNNIAKDIIQERGLNRLPSSDACHFYYPDLENAKVSSRKQGAATIEMLLGPWQILRFGHGAQRIGSAGYYFYSMRTGETEDEFMYMLDFIFTYQLLDDEDSVCIRMPYAREKAHPAFEKAKERYAEEFWALTEDSKKEFVRRVERITLKKITDIVAVFSKIEIGMTRHG